MRGHDFVLNQDLELLSVIPRVNLWSSEVLRQMWKQSLLADPPHENVLFFLCPVFRKISTGHVASCSVILSTGEIKGPAVWTCCISVDSYSCPVFPGSWISSAYLEKRDPFVGKLCQCWWLTRSLPYPRHTSVDRVFRSPTFRADTWDVMWVLNVLRGCALAWMA